LSDSVWSLEVGGVSIKKKGGGGVRFRHSGVCCILKWWTYDLWGHRFKNWTFTLLNLITYYYGTFPPPKKVLSFQKNEYG
jgi:hypothetical protein